MAISVRLLFTILAIRCHIERGQSLNNCSQALKAITIPIAMDFCATKRQIDRGTEGREVQALCSENESSAVNAFTDSEARVGDNRVPELDYLSKPRHGLPESKGALVRLSWVDIRANPWARQISKHRGRYTPSDRIATVVIVPNRDPGGIELRPCRPQGPEIDAKFEEDDVTKLRVKHTAASASSHGRITAKPETDGYGMTIGNRPVAVTLISPA
jgi:hypothetical protein